MSYLSIRDMALSPSLKNRCAACAAQEGYPGNAQVWIEQVMWTIAAAPGWGESWDSAQAAETINQNPDMGARGDVITDPMILAVVQPLVLEAIADAESDDEEVS